jgi:hypothetical protein
MTKQTSIILILTLLLTTSFVGQEKDELYLNYVAAIKNFSTFQYFLVVKVKDSKNGTIREYCTKGNFLKGALHREYNLRYNIDGISKVYSIAIDNKERYFEFKKKKAIKNLTSWNYSIDELTQLEKTVNFDSIVSQIKTNNNWSMEIFDDKTMLMYAHSLFNRGILTGENSCYGGTLVYVNRNKKE